MPLYEYKCHRCGKTFEIIQKFVDAPLQVHKECGGAVERLVSVSALQFKGTGWYVTDYAGNGKGSGAKEKTEAPPETKTESKTESKTATKPAAPSTTTEK